MVSGAFVGVAILARVDGLLLAAAPATAWLVDRGWGPWRDSEPGRRLGAATLLLAASAAVIVMAPWLARNLATFGSAFPSAGGHTLWITSYNEQFSISSNPTLASYLDWGLVNIIGSKVAAWWEIGWRTVVLLGGIFGFFFFAGLWRERRRGGGRAFPRLLGRDVRGHGRHLHLPCPAWRVLPLGGGLAPLRPAYGRGGHRPRPDQPRPGVGLPPTAATHRFVEIAALVGAIVLSLIGSASLYQLWESSHQRDIAAAEYLEREGLTHDVVLYGDPASLWHLTANPGVAAPFDPYPVIEEVVRAYDVRVGDRHPQRGRRDRPAGAVGRLRRRPTARATTRRGSPVTRCSKPMAFGSSASCLQVRWSSPPGTAE